jgi:hypothetical protein
LAKLIEASLPISDHKSPADRLRRSFVENAWTTMIEPSDTRPNPADRQSEGVQGPVLTHTGYSGTSATRQRNLRGGPAQMKNPARLAGRYIHQVGGYPNVARPKCPPSSVP